MSQPKYYGLNELREMFLHFFETKGHLRLPSFSLIPQNDASLLLINSGMAPMKPFFTGEQEPPRHRVTTCQKCIRTGDIENIGHTARHGTYFEMLGNFSFGDYFKTEAIHWAWEFLTSPEWVGLDPNRLYPSVFAGNETTPADDEAFRIWHEEIGIPEDRIFKFGNGDEAFRSSRTAPKRLLRTGGRGLAPFPSRFRLVCKADFFIAFYLRYYISNSAFVKHPLPLGRKWHILLSFE